MKYIISKAVSIIFLCNVVNITAESSSRIVGGSDVQNDEYPWFARTISNGICGGVLVSPNYVLTAAHCVAKKSEWLSSGGFQVGALCYASDNCKQKSETFKAIKVIQHPSYIKGRYVQDFALVKLDGTSTITPANIDSTGLSQSYEQLNAKSDLWAVGLGLLKAGTMNLPDHLQHVEVNYVTNNECKTTFKNFNYDTDSMICAAAPSKDACNGDSGGPLYDKENDTVVGLTSWGIGCADERFPGVYSRISSGFPWIKQTICNDNTAVKPSFCFCNPDENHVKVDVNITGGRFFFRVKSGGKVIKKKLFKTTRSDNFCFPNDQCLNFIMTTKGGTGNYSILFNGEEVKSKRFKGRSIQRMRAC